MQRDRHMTVIWVTHDLALLARIADRVHRHVSRKGGRGDADSSSCFAAPEHPLHARTCSASLRTKAQLRTVPDRCRRPDAAGVAGGPRTGRTLPAGRAARCRRLADIDLAFTRARPWRWSARAARARARLARAWYGHRGPRRGRAGFRGSDITGLAAPPACRARSAGICRWCFRTRSARSIRASASARRSPSR